MHTDHIPSDMQGLVWGEPELTICPWNVFVCIHQIKNGKLVDDNKWLWINLFDDCKFMG